MLMINIPETQNSPEIVLDTDKLMLSISGNSYLVDPGRFYKLLFSWGENFKCPQSASLHVKVRLGYYSTSSIQMLNYFFRTLNKNNPGRIVLKFLLDKEEEDLVETANALVYNTGLKPELEKY